MEMVGPKKRVVCGLVIELYFTVGELLVAGIAYWFRDWRTVVTVITVPVFCSLLYWPVLPESVRLVDHVVCVTLVYLLTNCRLPLGTFSVSFKAAT